MRSSELDVVLGPILVHANVVRSSILIDARERVGTALGCSNGLGVSSRVCGGDVHFSGNGYVAGAQNLASKSEGGVCDIEEITKSCLTVMESKLRI